jgi:twinkle protein
MDDIHRDTDRVASEFMMHDSCEECGSSDAKSIYSDGHAYCFSCHTYFPADGERRPMTGSVSLLGEARKLDKRGLSEQTCKKYKIHRDGDYLRHYYHSKDGVLLGCKVKTKDKQFWYEGDSDGSFFGQHLWPSTGKRVVITEGELDAASCSEVQPTWPMVSLPSGAASAKKAIQQNLEFLQGYEEIVLFFDNDEPGRKAAKECADILPPGTCSIASLAAYKDASEALQNNDRQVLIRAIWDAKPYRPDGIVEGKSLLAEITRPQPPNDYDYGIKGLDNLLHGIRHGELVTITAGSGTGKSSFCRHIAAHLLQDGNRVGYLALEESNRRTALGLMSTAVGTSLHMGEHAADDLIKIYDQTLANWNLYLFDGFGSYDPDVIYNRIEYLAVGLDTKVIFLDHLSILLSGLDGDERKTIDRTMTRLRSLVERTGISLFLVSHLRRAQSDHNHEEGARVTLGQLRGSASIAQLSDGVIALERDQQGSSEHSDTTVRVLKNRYSGETGVACTIRYDLDSCKFTENEAQPDFDATTDF